MAIKKVTSKRGEDPKKVSYIPSSRKASPSDTVPKVKPVAKVSKSSSKPTAPVKRSTSTKDSASSTKYTARDSANYQAMKVVPMGQKNKALSLGVSDSVRAPYKKDGEYQYRASKWNANRDSLESNRYFQQKVGEKEKKSMRSAYSKLYVSPEGKKPGGYDTTYVRNMQKMTKGKTKKK